MAGLSWRCRDRDLLESGYRVPAVDFLLEEVKTRHGDFWSKSFDVFCQDFVN